MAAIWMIRKPIPTNIVTGFLGSGKTTAILDLLQRKPAVEKWAVLVNEFGEIGVDGAILANHGAEIREVAGGCMCCAAGVPMQVALNMLIAKAKPDRLLIEPTGLGHPRQIIETLTGDYYRDVLNLRAVITLIDPRKLQQSRYREHTIYREQLQAADVLVANKADLCDSADENYFRDFVARSEPAPQASGWIAHGQLDLSWLDLPHRHYATSPLLLRSPASATDFLSPQLSIELSQIELPQGELAARRERIADGFYSCGWVFAASVQFDFQRLFIWASGMQVTRLKAILRTDRGNYFLNAEDGVLSVNDAGTHADNILEIIHDSTIDAGRIECELLSMQCDSTGNIRSQ